MRLNQINPESIVVKGEYDSVTAVIMNGKELKFLGSGLSRDVFAVPGGNYVVKVCSDAECDENQSVTEFKNYQEAPADIKKHMAKVYKMFDVPVKHFESGKKIGTFKVTVQKRVNGETIRKLNDYTLMGKYEELSDKMHKAGYRDMNRSNVMVCKRTRKMIVVDFGFGYNGKSDSDCSS